MGETVTEQLHVEVKAKVLNVRFKGSDCLSQLRPHRDQHADRDRAYADAALAGKHRHGLDAGLRARSQYVDGTPPYRLA